MRTRTAEHNYQIIEDIRHTASIVATMPPDLRASAIAAYKAALRGVYMYYGGVSILNALCCLPIREFPLASTFAEEETQRRE